MATKKGQKRKTARRAYMPKRKYSRKAKSKFEIGIIPAIAAAYALEQANQPPNAESAWDWYKSNAAQGDYNPFSRKYQDTSPVEQAVYGAKENAKSIVGALVVAGAAMYVRKHTSIGRKLVHSGKDVKIGVF